MLKRLKEYIDFKGISVAAFEKSIGMSNASFGKSLKSGGTIGADKLENILLVYDDLNIEWAILGKGEMLKGQGKDPPGEEIYKSQRETIETQKRYIAFLENRITELEALNQALQDMPEEHGQKRKAG